MESDNPLDAVTVTEGRPARADLVSFGIALASARSRGMPGMPPARTRTPRGPVSRSGTPDRRGARLHPTRNSSGRPGRRGPGETPDRHARAGDSLGHIRGHHGRGPHRTRTSVALRARMSAATSAARLPAGVSSSGAERLRASGAATSAAEVAGAPAPEPLDHDPGGGGRDPAPEHRRRRDRGSDDPARRSRTDPTTHRGRARSSPATRPWGRGSDQRQPRRRGWCRWPAGRVSGGVAQVPADGDGALAGRLARVRCALGCRSRGS